MITRVIRGTFREKLYQELGLNDRDLYGRTCTFYEIFKNKSSI